jgi:pimeloyl-ACP methyl ester carboxylesterase
MTVFIDRRGFNSLAVASVLTSALFSTVSAQDGSPITIVFFHGLGADTRETFGKLIRKIGGSSPIFATDRSGYNSRYNNQPRDGETIARETYSALANNGIRPPFLVVGHSLGGLYAQYFARLFGNEVLGMLLIDPTIIGQAEFLERNYPEEFATLNLIMAFWPKVQKEEFKYSRLRYQSLANLPIFQGRSAILMASRIAGMENPANYFRYRSDELQRLANQYSASFEQVNSGHFIQNERTELVLEKITALIA